MSNANKTRCLFKRIRSRLKRRFFFPGNKNILLSIKEKGGFCT